MKNAFIMAALAVCMVTTVPAETAGPLQLQRTIVLPGISGKFDHFAFDEAGNRLFAATTGNSSVQVVDLASGTILQSLNQLGKPHGLVWIPETGRLFVADGSKAELDVFEGTPLKLAKSIKLSEDADDMVADRASGFLFVGHGGTNAANPAAIAVVDMKSLSLMASLPVSAHPEALEIDTLRDRVFANISDAGEVVVIDGKTHHITQKWSLQGEKGNTPLAYDEQHDRLLVGCRNPAKLILLDGRTGKEIARGSADDGADDLFYDVESGRAYLIAGSGVIDSYQITKDGKLTTMPPTQTASGAKTGLLVSSKKALFVGVPGTGGEPAQIRVYATGTK